MLIAGLILFILAWGLAFVGFLDALAPLKRRLYAVFKPARRVYRASKAPLSVL